jgi:hypothetical protein
MDVSIDSSGPAAAEVVPILYRVEGGRLTVCVNKAGKGRPRDLTPGPGKRVVVFRRDER